jgi:ubiquitin C-terminal hydrolase
LHAIIIHDGVANSGHYYAYVYDRVQKIWWKLNDHDVSVAEEEALMEEAFGQPNSYKSACNLIYVNDHILKNL